MCLFTKDKFPREALSKIYVYKVLLSQFIGLDKNNIHMYRYLSPFTRDYQYHYGINEPVRAGEEKDYYSVEDIRESYWETQLRKLALGMCKIVLGRIRSKYKSNSAKFQLDGDTLLAEGNAEVQAVRQFLDDNKDIFTVLN